MAFSAVVDFACPASDAFALLSEPSRRPEWQPSLRRVEMIDQGPSRTGLRWYDVLVVGARPRMQIVAWEQDRVWAEHGSWRGLELDLVLRFEEHDGRTRVTAEASADAAGLLRPASWVLDLLGPLVARQDLARAARIVRADR